MTEKMIENRVKKLRDIEAQQKELETQAEAIRAELKADLEENTVLGSTPFCRANVANVLRRS